MNKTFRTFLASILLFVMLFALATPMQAGEIPNEMPSNHNNLEIEIEINFYGDTIFDFNRESIIEEIVMRTVIDALISEGIVAYQDCENAGFCYGYDERCIKGAGCFAWYIDSATTVTFVTVTLPNGTVEHWLYYHEVTFCTNCGRVWGTRFIGRWPM